MPSIINKDMLELAFQQNNGIYAANREQLEIEPTGFKDPLFAVAVTALPVNEPLPVSFLQRRFKLGYQRAVLLHNAIKASKPKSI